MSIRIEGLTGPHKGQVFEFDNNTPTILFGRSPSAQMRFEENKENEAISRHHVELTLQTDRYHIRLQDDNPVFLDGHEGFEDEEIDLGTHTFCLGDLNGPTYKVTTQSQDAHLAETAPIYKKQKSARQSAKSGFKKVSVAIIAVIAISAVAYQLLFMKTEEIASELTVFTEEFDNKTTSDEFAQILRTKRESVYLVAMRKDGRLVGSGTAWVAGNGILATNAHVVDGVASALQSGGFDDAVVVSTQPPYTQHVIEQMISHPDYERFFEHQEALPRIMDNNQQLNLVPGYDVALMQVSKPAELAPALTIAPTEDLLSLDSGDTIAFLGFPIEDTMGGGTNYEQPSPQMQIGAITSMSDYFMTGGNPARNHLIQHNLPAHGGASGSPLFNIKGEVIGLFNAGTVVHISNHRVATGVGINFGQRVDILTELASGTYEDIRTNRNEFWGNRLANYRTPIEIIIEEFKAKLGKGKERIIYSDNGSLKYDAENKANLWLYEIPASSQKRDIFAIAQSDTGEDINLAFVTKQGQIVVGDKKPNSFPFATVEDGAFFDSTKSYYLYVFGFKPGVKFKVRLFDVPR